MVIGSIVSRRHRRGRKAIRRIRFRIDVAERLKTPAGNTFVFTMETEFPGSGVHSRMLAPLLGVADDAATGSASGPLGCYLVRHAVVSSAAARSMLNLQGKKLPNVITVPLTPRDMSFHHWVPIKYWRNRIVQAPFLHNI